MKMINNKKICYECKGKKELVNFSKSKIHSDGLQSYCKLCVSQKNKQYSLDNKTRRNEYFKLYRLNNKEMRNQYSRQWYVENKEYFKNYNREYFNKRRKLDPIFNLSCTLRIKTYHILRKNNFSKCEHFYDYLGCTGEGLRKHIESKFTKGMNWAKVLSAEIEIDHILPLSSANTIEEVYKLCHVSNLQPLWKAANRSKGGY